jgi:hypothetical protein
MFLTSPFIDQAMSQASDVRVVSFRSSIAHTAYTPVYAPLCPSRQQRKTRGRVDRYSFLLRILLCSALFFRAT